MERISKDDLEYIKYVYDNRQKYVKPDTKRIIRLYNQVMPDGKHIFHPVSEQICACSLSPYLIQLYRKLEKEGYYKEEEVKEKKPKKPKNTKTTKKK